MRMPASPLVPAEDAVHLDTTALNLEQVCALAEDMVLAKLPKGGGAVGQALYPGKLSL